MKEVAGEMVVEDDLEAVVIQPKGRGIHVEHILDGGKLPPSHSLPFGTVHKRNPRVRAMWT